MFLRLILVTYVALLKRMALNYLPDMLNSCMQDERYPHTLGLNTPPNLRTVTLESGLERDNAERDNTAPNH